MSHFRVEVHQMKEIGLQSVAQQTVTEGFWFIRGVSNLSTGSSKFPSWMFRFSKALARMAVKTLRLSSSSSELCFMIFTKSNGFVQHFCHTSSNAKRGAMPERPSILIESTHATLLPENVKHLARNDQHSLSMSFNISIDLFWTQTLQREKHMRGQCWSWR